MAVGEAPKSEDKKLKVYMWRKHQTTATTFAVLEDEVCCKSTVANTLGRADKP